MPVVKIEFLTEEDLQKGKSFVLEHQLNGKAAYLEEERRDKVIRCFICHRFGHISRITQPDVEYVPVRHIQSLTVLTKVNVLTVKVIIQPLQKLPCLSTSVSATEIQSLVLIPLKTLQT